MGPEPVIWLGAAGTATAHGLLRSIRRHWGVRVSVVAADSSPWWLVAASRLADTTEQTPMVSDPGFLEFMVDALRRLHVDIYVPILDEEILVAAELREARRLPEGLKVWAPRAEVSDICLDKLRAAEWLKARGLPWSPSHRHGFSASCPQRCDRHRRTGTVCTTGSDSGLLPLARR